MTTADTMRAAVEALEPCPFCGGAASLALCGFGTAKATCMDCGSEGSYSPTREDAIAAWNRRASIPPNTPVEAGKVGVADGVMASESPRCKVTGWHCHSDCPQPCRTDGVPAVAPATKEDFPYTRTFNAIAAAARLANGGTAIGISVQAFIDAWNAHPASGVAVPAKPLTDAECWEQGKPDSIDRAMTAEAVEEDPPCGHMVRGIRKPYCERCQRAALGVGVVQTPGMPAKLPAVGVALNMCMQANSEAKLPVPICWDLALYVKRLEDAVALGVKEVDRG